MTAQDSTGRPTLVKLSRRQILATATFCAAADTVAAAEHSKIPARLRAFGLFTPYYANPGETLPRYREFVDRAPNFLSDNADETRDWWGVTTSWQDYIWKSGRIPATIVLGCPMLPRRFAGQLARIMSGEFDQHYLAMAKAAKPMLDRKIDKGAYTFLVRLGWEFNGSWMPWFAKDPTAFIAAWRRIVGLFRGVDSRFRFSWCMTLGQMNADSFACYPGDEFVDVVDTDVYDEAWNSHHRSDVVSRFKERFQDGKFGLVAYAEFSEKHSKPRGFSEWGLRNMNTQGSGGSGGDNPYFIEQMAAHFDALGDRLSHQCYFERAEVFSALSQGKSIHNPDGTWTKTPTPFPNGAEAFKRMFGRMA